MKEICYKNNFITEAICKVEFLNPIPDLNKTIPKGFSDEIRKIFPIAETKEIKSNKVVLSNKGEVQNHVEIDIEWVFWNKGRNQRVSLSKNSLLMVHHKYISFEIFENNFLEVFKSLNKVFPDLIFNRFGVRYVNSIKIPEPKPLEWKEYINEKLISSINIPKDSDRIIRTFHNLEMNYDNFNLRFNFGIHNPDYPAIVKQKVFILDMDAYHMSLQNKEDIIEKFPKFHEKIQELFEFSITNNLRKKYLKNE